MIFYTEEQILSTVTDHLINQGSQCRVNGDCVYRGENGLQCAVGVLIPDECYSDRLELAGIVDLFEEKAETDESLGFNAWEHIDLLHALQIVHDETHPNLWPKLKSVSAKELKSISRKPISYRGKVNSIKELISD